MSLCELHATGSPCTVRLSTVSVVDRVRPLYIRDLGSSISSRHDRPIFRVPSLQHPNRTYDMCGLVASVGVSVVFDTCYTRYQFSVVGERKPLD